MEAMPLTPGEARGYLARFLFRGDDAFKEVRSLSGGERSRLELALLGILPSNLLLLDEPTNHLDIAAREAIEAFLAETPATLLVVSHDRRLLETICERLWVVDDGLAVPFDGGYRAWRQAVAEGWTVEAEAAAAPEPGPAPHAARSKARDGQSTASGARRRGGALARGHAGAADGRRRRRRGAGGATTTPTRAQPRRSSPRTPTGAGARRSMASSPASACGSPSWSSPWARRRSRPTSWRCAASRASSPTSSAPSPRRRTHGSSSRSMAP